MKNFRFQNIRKLFVIVPLLACVLLGACDELGEATCSFFTGDCSDPPINGLSASKAYEVVDAEYNLLTDQVIATTLPAPLPVEERANGPFYLVSVNPVNQAERKLELSGIGLYVSIGPGGMDAAVVLGDLGSYESGSGATAQLVYVDLEDMAVVDTYPVTGVNASNVADVVLDGDGYAHVFSNDRVFSVDLMTGAVTQGETGLSYAKAKLAADGDGLIVIAGGTLQRLDITSGVAMHEMDSPSGRDLTGCGPYNRGDPDPQELLALSNDGSRIITPCGDVFSASSLSYLETINYPEIYPEDWDDHLIHMAAYDDVSEIAGLSFVVVGGLYDQPVVGFFNPDNGELNDALLPLRPGHSNQGRFLFFSSDGKRIVTVILAGVYPFPGPSMRYTQFASYPVPN
ncbi:MAG: hypothetical protein KDH09_16385 [Chrysiogenetes bacterium]|nr:hypothetical protein [Chrysiogenetes bacterium]